ncbi:MAG: hypothetical protein ACI9NT_001739 [Bacteroidia bacterium]
MADAFSHRQYSRRTLLRRSAVLPALSLGLLTACSNDTSNQTQNACFDPQYLGAGEAQMRKTLEYINLSENTATQCFHCAFYRTAEAAACGDCEILDGPVAAAGYCTSWAARG